MVTIRVKLYPSAKRFIHKIGKKNMMVKSKVKKHIHVFSTSVLLTQEVLCFSNQSVMLI
jgi:hypothetical protein